MSIFQVLMFLPFFFQQGAVLDETQMRFREAMELASAEGIPSLIQKLDAIAKADPSSPFTPSIQETISVIGLLHPGSVPDRATRLERLRASAAGNPGLAKVLKCIDILQSYYAAAAQGNPGSASAALSDPVFEGTTYGIQALADAALRAGDYGKATMLASRVIEEDPYSPLLSNAYMILGLSSAFRGDYKSALIQFQHSLAVSPLPTLYGDPRDFVFTAYRFARPAPADVGGIFDEVQVNHLPRSVELKDPQAMLFSDKGYVLLDKEMILTISPEGKILDKKDGRKIEDIAVAKDGKIYSVTDRQIDLGTGTMAMLSLSGGKKTKRLTNLRSLATGIQGDIYILDRDAGLLRVGASVAAGSLSPVLFAPVRGRLVRTDRWGRIYVLAEDQKSILVLSREGKALTSVSPDPVAGKSPVIEYFAFDSLNHLYILEPNSIQIFAIRQGSAGYEKKRVGMFEFDQRSQFKNLRALGVSADGGLVVTGKNEDNWICFR